MRKIFLVAQREFLDNVRTKSFWIGLLILPVMLVLMIAVPSVLEKVKTARNYAVHDQSGWLLEAVDRRILASDFAEIIAVAANRQRLGGTSLAESPDMIRRIGPAAAAIPDSARRAAADALAADTGAAMWPGAEGLWAARAALAAWWNELPSDDVRRIVPRGSRARYIRENIPLGADTAQATLNRMVGGGRLFAHFVIGPDPVEGDSGSQYVSKNLTDEDLKDWFEGHATAVVQQRRMERERIQPRVARWLQERVSFEEQKVTTGGEAAEVSESDQLRQWAPVVFVYLLWISIFSVTQMLLTNTVEEKSNRLIEVLLSSVSPVELMAGKIAGIAATGLTIVASWILSFLVVTGTLPRMMGAGIDLSALANQPLFLLSFMAYFILGYLLYASLLVGIGAISNTLKEAQNLVGPITILLIIPLVAMVPIGRDPNGPLARVLSYVPPFTPFVMMNRAAGPPSLMDYVLTTILLGLSVAVALWAAAKVFRIGILMTGKPPKLAEIIRWIRSPVGVVPAKKDA